MKYRNLLTVLLGTVPLLIAADQKEVAVVLHDRVNAALANKADIYLVKADNLAVEGNYRDKAGTVEVHENLTDIMYITDGEATILTGGTYEGGKPTTPGQIRGGTITGAESHRLVKGDVIVIPSGIPHQFKEVPKTVSYFVVKVPNQGQKVQYGH